MSCCVLGTIWLLWVTVMALRLLDHHVIVRGLEGTLIHCILCTNVPWPLHTIQWSSFSLNTPPSNFGRCLEVVELQCYFQPCTRVPMKSCLAFNTDLDGLSPHSATSLGWRESPNRWRGRRDVWNRQYDVRSGWTVGYGILTAYVQQVARPELAETIRATTLPPWLWWLGIREAAMDLVVRSPSRKPLMDVESNDTWGSPMKGRGTATRGGMQSWEGGILSI